MRAGTVTLLSISLLALAGTALPGAPAEARGGPAHHRGRAAPSDSGRTLARMAERDRILWGRWEHERPVASYVPPLTRQRVAAPPLTGWGYGGTVPGAWPGF